MFLSSAENGVVVETVQAFERADDPWSERHIDQATTMRVVNFRAGLLRHFVERLVRKAKQRRLEAQRRAVIGHATPHLAAGESHHELENRRRLTGLGLVGRPRLVHHEEGGMESCGEPLGTVEGVVPGLQEEPIVPPAPSCAGRGAHRRLA
jgi:hypothetical protein